jgi:hypothetical protein
LSNVPSLQTLVLKDRTLGSAGLVELAPALCHNTSIKVLDLSEYRLGGRESAEILRDILRSNKTITSLALNQIKFGQATGAVACIAAGLDSNSTLLKIDLSDCALRDRGLSSLTQAFGSWNTALQRLAIGENAITSTGIAVLLVAMEQSSHQITDLDLNNNPIGNEGARLLAGAVENNALPNLTRLSLYGCSIQDDGFVALVSALEQNTSLQHLDLRSNYALRAPAFLALADSLPAITVLQRVDLSWYEALAPAIPLLLAGLRTNTSLFRFHFDYYVPSVPPTIEETTRCPGGWMQEIELFGYRNRFLPFFRAPTERPPPRGIWPYALARVAALPDVIFDFLRARPNLDFV